MKASVTAFIRAALTIAGCGEDGEINRPVAQHRRNEQSKTLESGGITVKVTAEGVDEFGI